MSTKDLKIGEYSLVEYSSGKKDIIFEDSFGYTNLTSPNYRFSLLDIKNLEVQKLENVKITYDGCEKTKDLQKQIDHKCLSFSIWLFENSTQITFDKWGVFNGEWLTCSESYELFKNQYDKNQDLNHLIKETKSEFPKMMYVGDNKNFINYKKIVVGVLNNNYLVQREDEEDVFVSYKYAKDVEPETNIELTLEEISKKLGLKDNEKLVIK